MFVNNDWPRCYYYNSPSKAWWHDFVHAFDSPDIQIWAEDSEGVPNWYKWSSVHLNSVSSVQELKMLGDGRGDRFEAVSTWLQPQDIGEFRFEAPPFDPIVATAADFGGPISFSYDAFTELNVFCMYAIWAKGAVGPNGDVELTDAALNETAERFRNERRIQDFGEWSVVTQPSRFIPRAKARLQAIYRTECRLVEYYDPTTFSGHLPNKRIPFMKQDRFAFQREFRICVAPTIATGDVIEPDIDDISGFSYKVPSLYLPTLQFTRGPTG